MTANTPGCMFTKREVSRDISIYQDYYGNWGAGVEIKLASADGMVGWHEYHDHGDSPESALAALKQAVMEGEEGWTW